jgi:hypothetical protein
MGLFQGRMLPERVPFHDLIKQALIKGKPARKSGTQSHGSYVMDIHELTAGLLKGLVFYFSEEEYEDEQNKNRVKRNDHNGIVRGIAAAGGT